MTAAGGAQYAADTSTVKLIRPDRQGRKIVFVEDLERIKNGHGVDMLEVDPSQREPTASLNDRSSRTHHLKRVERRTVPRVTPPASDPWP